VLEVYHDGRRVRVKSPTLADFQVHLPRAPAVVEIERGSLVKDDTRAPLTTRGERPRQQRHCLLSLRLE
jgi:hypothetical protein